jgi:hypothetical protein
MIRRIGTTLRLALASLCLVFIATDASAEYVIKNDLGGSLKFYWAKFAAIRDSGENVVIDGECVSACTLVLSVIPRDRICVTKKASLAFHADRHEGTMTIYEDATQRLFKSYPDDIQKWVIAKKALESIKETALRGAELEAMIKRCSPDIYEGRRK